MDVAAREHDSKSEALARLAQSRAEIRHVLEPPAHEPSVYGEDSAQRGQNFSQFPRSRTMRVLMSGRGLGTVGAMVGGLVLARPAMALRVLRMLPVGAVARMLLIRAVTAFRSR